MKNTHSLLVICALLIAATLEYAVAQDDKAPAIPDLRELMAKPHSEMRGITRHFEADRGSLNRLYPIAGSPTRIARMQRFYSEWLTALDQLKTDKLSQTGRADFATLKENVQKELEKLAEQAAEQAEIAPLLPFASTIIQLEESRRRMEDVKAAQAAGLVHEMKKQIEHARKSLTNPPKAGPTQEAKFAKETISRAAAGTKSLRTQLKNWHTFYNGYDPLFTWWMSEPYKEVDQALQDYETALSDIVKKMTVEAKANGEPTKRAASASSTLNKQTQARGNDVPDLQSLLAGEDSEMRGVIERFQADRGGNNRLASARPPIPGAPRSPERQARTIKLNAAWRDALEKLDFDKLSHDGQIDYLLLMNTIKQGIRRQELSNRPAIEKPKDSSGINGAPIGREALINELLGEMIPYSPEELIVIANREFDWCDDEIKKAARAMGFGDDWRKAVEKVKTLHVEPGKQPAMIRDLAQEAIQYLDRHDLVTVPPLARETWRMEMMSPQRQLVNPFFTGGEVISVSFPTNTMAHEAKLQSMRGNNIHFGRATVHHELIPGHHLQGYMSARHRPYRGLFSTPFWGEGWALYWEFVLYDRDFIQSPEDRVGFLFWRMHRCARIIFSLGFHLGKMSPQECIDFLVDRVGHERENATAEVRRSFAGSYGPLYQAAYMLGGLQIRALRQELVDSGKMSNRAFHDAILKENRIPIAMVRASLTQQKLSRDYTPDWKFYGPISTIDK